MYGTELDDMYKHLAGFVHADGILTHRWKESFSYCNIHIYKIDIRCINVNVIFTWKPLEMGTLRSWAPSRNKVGTLTYRNKFKMTLENQMPHRSKQKLKAKEE
jgi:hypothetical protein